MLTFTGIVFSNVRDVLVVAILQDDHLAAPHVPAVRHLPAPLLHRR